ncbi:aminoacyl-tRNA hydrolase [Mycoplasmoides alvi]|uniref:aminoacyl-tRNA hydrolase n=1 Tax=Mycoplasmoides alvi TaxID=78580 RepID=UPI000AACFA8E|nr:aminoacyl-tRNA hydrolase [Mycoplasmoides alvi]
MSLKLIVGLGNPGKQYENTRHNVGFMFVDKLCDTLGLSLTNEGFKGLFVKSKFNDQDFIISKPQTFMNLSGIFVRQLSDFYKIWPQNILIIYDDLAFNLGQIKLRLKGSSGGHNGMQNIIKCMSTDKIKRIRVGIGPQNNKNLANFVLSNFLPNESILLDLGISKATLAACDFLEKNDFSNLMNKYNV